MFEKFYRRCVSCLILTAFISLNILPPQSSYAQLIPSAQINLPNVGERINVSQVYAPTLIKGLSVDQNDPFKFEFLMDTGDSNLQGEALKSESYKMIKYFMASLATPEKDMWVNLSPYEKDRIIPDTFGQTEMGRDLLAQDYILKQLTSSLMSPEGEIGKEFWNKIYERLYEITAGAQRAVPLQDGDEMQDAVNTFNKVWIVPQTGYFFEHNNSVFIVDAKLKVMLEEDYVAYQKSVGAAEYGLDSRGVSLRGGAEAIPDKINSEEIASQKTLAMTEQTKQIIREIIIPVIEQEINEGANFANLRQIYNAMLLSVWFKKRLKDHILGQAYADKEHIQSIALNKQGEIEAIWTQYVDAFKTGVYDMIKEEYDPQTQSVVPRKYFSGGMVAFQNVPKQSDIANVMLAVRNLKNPVRVDAAMMTPKLNEKTIKQIDAIWRKYEKQLQDAGQYDNAKLLYDNLRSDRPMLFDNSASSSFEASIKQALGLDLAMMAAKRRKTMGSGYGNSTWARIVVLLLRKAPDKFSKNVWLPMTVHTFVQKNKHDKSKKISSEELERLVDQFLSENPDQAMLNFKGWENVADGGEDRPLNDTVAPYNAYWEMFNGGFLSDPDRDRLNPLDSLDHAEILRLYAEYQKQFRTNLRRVEEGERRPSADQEKMQYWTDLLKNQVDKNGHYLTQDQTRNAPSGLLDFYDSLKKAGWVAAREPSGATRQEWDPEKKDWRIYFNNAMMDENEQTQGGVNLRSDQADIQIQTSENGFKFPKIDPAMFNDSLKNMVPVILDIVPMPKSEVMFRLGLATTPQDEKETDISIPSEKAKEPESGVILSAAKDVS